MANTSTDNPSKTRIIFRADGNSQIGLGHVVRSLALAQMLREEYECVFAIQAPTPELQVQIRQVCHGLIILPRCLPGEDRFLHELNAYLAPDVLVVLDGYCFGTAYQQSIKSKGCGLVCIDDINAYSFVADVVINQAGGLETTAYAAEPYTKLLLGPAYALLRQPFLVASRQKRGFPAGALQVLLNMGGADPENHTLQTAKELVALKSMASLEIVVGGAYKHLPELQQWLGQQPMARLHQNLSAVEMRRLMQRSALAITSASGVAYEYAAVGGLLYIKQTADNQAALYGYLKSSGVARPYDSLKELAAGEVKTQFTEQLQIQRQYFDGKSDERLRQVFNALRLSAALTFRAATAEDLLLLYHWNNDPEVRRRSFNPEPIPLESHSRWFEGKLADPNSIIYLAEVVGEPVAQIRFELKEDRATISYLISEAYRGNGLGHTILRKGVEKLKEQRPELREVEGLVQLDNIASVRAFEKAGFSNGPVSTQHPEAHHFVLPLTA